MTTIDILNEITKVLRANDEPDVNDLIRVANRINDSFMEEELKVAYNDLIEAVLDLFI